MDNEEFTALAKWGEIGRRRLVSCAYLRHYAKNANDNQDED
jgi:hypothetical protein